MQILIRQLPGAAGLEILKKNYLSYMTMVRQNFVNIKEPGKIFTHPLKQVALVKASGFFLP